ncbi:pancreatic lipase-related protein 2-like [Apis dorsata]|uniref:pancreatic lipase-related protein 2-like n=1 Tax=Apis dorsata TaxID=7462 RepID=UPI001292D526|nr:pancreatic lipase-related protein 2-like [Apis dorsata]
MINIYFYFFFAFFNFLLTVADITQNVFLRLYNRNDSYIDENVRNANLFLPYIQKNKLLIILIHGFTEDINSYDIGILTSTYLKNTQHNIFGIDYRNVSKESYSFAKQDIYKIGKFMADVLDDMIDNGVNFKKIHLIGISLGAELAGIIGRNMNYKIGRITGLDPVGPGYYILNTHLSASDAEFVDVIHTDMGVYGLALKIGHVDFFPNYGYRPQPGCPISENDITRFCSHGRSIEFYVESIKNSTSFIGKCEFYWLNECNIEYIPMGYATPNNANGNYYLVTNSKSPFGQGSTGTVFNPLKIVPVL